MSLDLQIRNQTLLNLVRGNLQQVLNTTCIPPFPPLYIDHADVAGITMSVSPQAAQFQVPVNVFIVDQTSLQANLNGVPPGALIPAGQATLFLLLSVQGSQLSLACTSVTVPDPQFQGVAQQIQQAIGTVGTVALSSLFSQLGLPPPSSSSMQQVGSSLMIRFDAASQPVDHLQSGEDWCAFVDAATVQALAKTKINGPLSQLSGNGITGVNVATTWVPSGTTPHVNIKITGNAQVPNPFSGTDEICVRGSTCESVIIVGPGAPGGVRLPWAKTVERCELRVESATKASAMNKRLNLVFIMFSPIQFA